MASLNIFWFIAVIVAISAKHISFRSHQGVIDDKEVDEPNSLSSRHNHRPKRSPHAVKYIRPKLSADGVLTLIDLPYTTTPYNWGSGFWVVRQSPGEDLDEWSRKRRDSIDDPVFPTESPKQDKSPQQFCLLSKDTGVACPGIKDHVVVTQYYFNTQGNRCEPFSYDGCGGNGNRFSSILSCEQTCGNVDGVIGTS